MKIVSMTPSKHVSDRWYMELEGGEKIRITVDHIAEFSLYTGRELDDDELEDLREKAGRTASHQRAMRIVGARAMSHRELCDHMKKRGETDSSAEEAAQWLERMGVLNDAEYASAIVRHYSSSGYGEAKIKSELTRRGVGREHWDAALALMPEPDEMLDALIAKKLRTAAPDRAALKKLSDMLMRRGFKWDDVRRAIARCADGFEETY